MIAGSIDDYLRHVTLLSDQLDKRELAVILRELRRVIERKIDGDVVEFGCYEGTASVHLAQCIDHTDKHLYLYDSFEGLPEKTTRDESPVGAQFKAGELRASKKKLMAHLRQANVRIPFVKKAWFSEFTQHDVPSKVSFAFLDGDYYQSIRAPLMLLEKVVVSGAVIVVDDYANEALPGAARAVDEWVRPRGLLVTAEASLGIIRIP